MKQRFLILIIPLVLASCSKWVAPPYTSVEKMLSIEKGMNSNQVNETLGIKPYNLLHRNDSTSVFEYHYRLKDRDVNNISNYNEFIYSEKSQLGGKTWFTKPSKFYVLYENDKLSTLITENGLENSDYLLLKNNNLVLVSQSDLVEFNLLENASYLHKIENTEKLKASKNLRHNILYSANLPYGILGLKYAIGGKFGGYVSAAFSPEWETITYLTGGFMLRVKSNINIYLGGGVGPYYEYYDSGGWTNEELYMDAFTLETGTLFNLKKISLDAGFGVTFEQGLYGKIGFGFNF